jgi:hypothetical protein
VRKIHLVAAIAAGCCVVVGAASGGSARASTAQQLYSSATVWESHAPDRSTALLDQCGVEPIWLSPDDPRDAGCVVRAMRQTDASPDAVQLFEATRLFLLEFQERGTVDVGLASAPWSNMGRSQILLLNGTPSVISIFDLVPRDWQTDPAYAAYLGVLTWPEYGAVADSEMLADGSQRMLVHVLLRECRACPDLALMRLALTFDTDGGLADSRLLSPTPL